MSSKGERAAALAALAAAKRSGKRTTDGVEARLEEKKVFEEVDDEEYRKVVKERR